MRVPLTQAWPWQILGSIEIRSYIVASNTLMIEHVGAISVRTDSRFIDPCVLQLYFCEPKTETVSPYLSISQSGLWKTDRGGLACFSPSSTLSVGAVFSGIESCGGN